MESLLEFKNFSLKIGERKFIENFSLKVEKSNVVLIYGPRDAGKSALLRSMVHLNEELFESMKSEGYIFFKGKDVRKVKRKELRKKIAYIDTSFIESLSSLSVNQVIKLVKGNGVDLYHDEMIKLLKELEILDLLKKGIHTKVGELHGNERVLFLLFVALLREPEVVALDCIVDHLDDDAALKVQKVVLSLKQKYTLILATRRLPNFLSIADKVVVLQNGEAKFIGTKKEMMLTFSKEV
jgi:ABC-type cobalamin/Fe3+-siderophores transport system ATPase subunit